MLSLLLFTVEHIFFYVQFLCADGTNTQHEQLSGEGKKYHKNSQLTKSIEFQISSTRLPRFQFIKCINMQLIRQNDLKLVWGHLRNVNLLHLMGFLWSIWILLIFTEISNFSAVHLRQHEAHGTYQSKFARFLAQCWFASTKLIISISRIIFLRIFFLVDFSMLCSVKKNFSQFFLFVWSRSLFLELLILSLSQT